jgi:hypothetical protein
VVLFVRHSIEEVHKKHTGVRVEGSYRAEDTLTRQTQVVTVIDCARNAFTKRRPMEKLRDKSSYRLGKMVARMEKQHRRAPHAVDPATP